MSIKDENVSNCKHESVEQSRLEIKKIWLYRDHNE